LTGIHWVEMNHNLAFLETVFKLSVDRVPDEVTSAFYCCSPFVSVSGVPYQITLDAGLSTCLGLMEQNAAKIRYQILH